MQIVSAGLVIVTNATDVNGMLRPLHDVHDMCLCQNSHDNKSASSFSTKPMLSHWAVPELLDKILPFFNDVDGDLQCGLLLLTETFDQLLHRLNWLSINIIQQLLLKLLQPCPQLQRNNIIISQSDTSQYHEPVSGRCRSMGLQTNNISSIIWNIQMHTHDKTNSQTDFGCHWTAGVVISWE